ncbi:MAG: UbiX family flavin prenyltransferase [Thermoplasmata archaeon]|nr:UbiX family flavin prenyltransferase [Thermoplasmata archaeon]
MQRKRFFLGITGASGVIYGLRLLEELNRRGGEVHVAVSAGGWDLLRREVGVGRKKLEELSASLHDSSEMDTPLSSGSFKLDGSVIAPCTVSTASKIACGVQDNLITRAASVALKERWPLLLLIRETPLPAPVLRSLTYLSEIGVTVMPASPAFYLSPRGIDDLVDFIVRRILAHLGYEDSAEPYRPPEETSKKLG